MPLRLSEDLRFVIDHACNAMALVGTDAKPKYVNPAFVKILGYTAEDLQALTFMDFTHVDDVDNDVALFADLIDNSTECMSYTMQKRYYHKDGGVVHARLYVYRLSHINDMVFAQLNDLSDLQFQLEHSKILLDRILDGYWRIDVRRNYEEYSPQFWNILGYDPEEKKDEHRPEAWQELIHPADLPVALKQFEEHVRSRGQTPFCMEARYPHPDGRMVWVICKGQALEFDVQGQVTHMIGTHTDISAQKECEIALKSHALGVMQFIGNFSHEIRNFMNGIMGLQDILKHSDSYEAEVVAPAAVSASAAWLSARQEREENWRCLDEVSTALMTILNDALELSKAASGKLTVVPRRCNIRHMVRSIVSLFKARAQEKNVCLEVCLDKTPPPDADQSGETLESPDWVMLDADRVRQILQNLVSNAIKFTDAGGRVIVILHNQVENYHVSPSGKERFTLCFTVQDTGRGISQKQQQRLFRDFTQLRYDSDEDTCDYLDEELKDSKAVFEGARSAQHGRFLRHQSNKRNQERRMLKGTGMGLKLARTYAELMGGSLKVHSRVRVGSTFTLRLPSCPCSPDSDYRRQQRLLALSEIQDAVHLEVLAVDDVKINLKTIKFQLRKMVENFEISVTTASNGREALEVVKQAPSRFDVILMDLNMPIMNGYDSVAGMLKLPGFSRHRTVIVALTGDISAIGKDASSFIPQVQCQSSGFRYVLTKPVQKTALYKLLQLCHKYLQSSKAKEKACAPDLSDSEIELSLASICSTPGSTPPRTPASAITSTSHADPKPSQSAYLLPRSLKCVAEDVMGSV